MFDEDSHTCKKESASCSGDHVSAVFHGFPGSLQVVQLSRGDVRQVGVGGTSAMKGLQSITGTADVTRASCKEAILT